jgi:hypothetical protein
LSPISAAAARAQQIAMLSSSLFPTNKTPDSLQWSTEMNGNRSYQHLIRDAYKTMTCQDKMSMLEMGNNVSGTSFGCRSRVMPENDTRPGDKAWQGGKTHPFVSNDAYSSTIVKDLIFSGVDNNRWRVNPKY